MVEIREPYGFVYVTTNMINGKRYIGQKKFKKGWQIYLGSGVALTKALKRYGRDNFVRDIIYISYSEEDLNDKEIEFIYNYNANDRVNFYNIASGGKATNNFASKTEFEMKLFKEKQKKIQSQINHKYSSPKSKYLYKGEKVYCITTKEIFNSPFEASEKYNCEKRNIKACCKGLRKSCGKLEDNTKLKWLYYDEYLKGLK